MWTRRVALLLGALLSCAAGPAARREVALCADLWCPYNCAAGSARPGFALEIAQRALAAAGYRVTYHVLNWARCVEDARAGRFAGIIAAIPADAPDFTFPAQPIGISSDGYAVRRGDSFRADNLHDLEGRVLGTTSDYGFGGGIGAYIKAHAHDRGRIQFIAGEGALQKNLQKLLAGRVDVVLDDENVLRNAVAELGLETGVSVLHGPSVDPVFIAFSPSVSDRRDLARLLDAGIVQLRGNGGLAAIMAAYHLPGGS